MSKKLFKVVCSKEAIIYIAAEDEDEAEKWARDNHHEWEDDLCNAQDWDTMAYPSKLPLCDGWTPDALCYGDQMFDKPPKDVSCQDVMDGKLE